MTTQLNFADEFHYTDALSGISIPLSLGYGEITLRVSAKVDTGAEVCLFSNEDAVDLGIEVEKGIPITLSSLGGNVEAFGHEITIQTGST